MTPGSYLRLRRVAAGKSIEEVALLVHTDPPRDALYRAEWIAGVERDYIAIDRHLVLALHEVFAFDRMVLAQLVAIHVGAVIPAPDICRMCGCSWDDPCKDEFGHGCGWRTGANDLCTACPDRVAVDPGAIALPDRSIDRAPLPTGPLFEAVGANFVRTYLFGMGAQH